MTPVTLACALRHTDVVIQATVRSRLFCQLWRPGAAHALQLQSLYSALGGPPAVLFTNPNLIGPPRGTEKARIANLAVRATHRESITPNAINPH